MVGCVAQQYNIGLWPTNLSGLRSALDLQLMGDHLPSAIGQPTRPTEPVISLG